MTMWKVIGVGLLLTIGGQAGASTVFPVTAKCPIGGKSFSYMGYASYSTWGELPDGQPVGSAEFPLPMPQCPDNGLVLFEEFDPATVKRLTLIVLGPEYQALRRTETRQFLAHWLQERLERPAVERLWTLLAATWEAKNAGEPARATRYAEVLVAGIRALPDNPASIEALALKARAANALRELGRFDEADSLRASLVVLPAMGGEGEDARTNREGWTRYLVTLQPVIARRDAGRAPLDLIGERAAVFRCLDEPAADAFSRDFCARPAIKEQVDRVRAARQPPA